MFEKVKRVISSFCSSHSFKKSNESKSFSLLFLKERQERFAQIALFVKNNMSESLSSLFFFKEQHERNSEEQKSKFSTLQKTAQHIKESKCIFLICPISSKYRVCGSARKKKSHFFSDTEIGLCKLPLA